VGFPEGVCCGWALKDTKKLDGQGDEEEEEGRAIQIVNRCLQMLAGPAVNPTSPPVLLPGSGVGRAFTPYSLILSGRPAIKLELWFPT
jgi:hypothetical protein